MDAGALHRQAVRPPAHVLNGALDEAALYIANADDPARAWVEIEPALMSFLAGLKARPAGP